MTESKNGKKTSAQKEIPFEKGMQQLEEILKGLEAGDLSLEESIKLYAEGMKLTQLLDRQLKNARLKIEEIGGAD